MKSNTHKLTLLVLCASASLAQAGTNGFLVPFFRGSANSQAGYWETFSVAVGAPGNPPDKPGATTAARLIQSDTNAFLTGSGNIYNLNAASVFTLTNATPFTLGTVVLQSRTIGGELDYNSITLNYTNGSGSHSLAPLQRVELDRGNQPGLGATVSSLWQWDLSGLGVSSYFVSFQAAGASLSFDSLTLDTWDQFTALFTPPVSINNTSPAIERWMYANNAAPCDRPAGASFGTFGDDANVDTRHAQHLVGWDTASVIPTNRGPTSYLVRRARVTLTINRGNLFANDPTHDDYRTYFDTNHPSYLPDGDPGRPVELFGVGYRNGYDAASFDQCAPFGSNLPTQRNAYAAGYSTNGALVDISNNVGKTNAAFPPFEAVPFAVGQTTNAATGELVPTGAKITFDLNLSNPFVLAYVQNGLNSGRLRFMISSLHTSGGQFGSPTYPDFVTHFNEAVLAPTRLELEGVVVGSGDSDNDGLPDDWELFSLQSLTYNKTADPDGDGASNFAEFKAGTDPLTNTSALHISALQQNPGGSVTLEFPHAANRKYRIEFTENFSTWQHVLNPPLLYPNPGTARWTDDGTATGGLGEKCFYRVNVEQP
jgi:hypothetical protein